MKQPPYSAGEVRTSTERCSACGFCYKKWPDGPNECPRCVPGQSRPYGERLQDPTEFMGPEFLWNNLVGPTGSWEWIGDYGLIYRVSKETLNRVRALAGALPGIFPGNRGFLEELLDEVIRKNDLPTPLPDQKQRVRFDELADRLTRAEADLRRVRADRDELRDRVVELETRNGAIRPGRT